eukprot:2093853-Rhodomonas_salina.1
MIQGQYGEIRSVMRANTKRGSHDRMNGVVDQEREILLFLRQDYLPHTKTFSHARLHSNQVMMERSGQTGRNSQFVVSKEKRDICC